MKYKIRVAGYMLLIALLVNLTFLAVLGKIVFLVNSLLILIALLSIVIIGLYKSFPSSRRAKVKLSNRQWLDANITMLHHTYGNTWLAIADEEVIAADKSRSRLTEHLSKSPHKGKDVLIYFLEM